MPKRWQTRYLRAVALGAALLTAPLPAAAAIKCWTNAEGVRECGSVVPPEYAQERVEIRNERGLLMKVEEPAKTGAQLAEEARLARENEERQRRAEAQAREDRILLDTYMSEQDIVRSRDDKITAIESGIRLTENALERQQTNLDKLRQRAAAHAKRGDAVPEELAADIAELERQMENNRRYIEVQRAEQAEIRAEYQAYIERFRALTAANSP